MWTGDELIQMIPLMAGAMLVETPRGGMDWLSKYLEARIMAGSSVAGPQHDSTTDAIGPSGHNYDASEARFDGVAQYLVGC